MTISFLLYLLLFAPDAVKGPTCQPMCVWGQPCQPCSTEIVRPQHTNVGGKNKTISSRLWGQF